MSRRDFFKNFKEKSNSLKEVAVYYVNEYSRTYSYDYCELNRVSDELNGWFSNILEGGSYVGVSLDDYFFLPVFILALWKGGKSFAGAGKQYALERTKYFFDFLKVKYVITDNESFGEIICDFYIWRRRFFISRRKEVKESSSNVWDMCYGIMTSGSTGAPKIIQVPWFCILPNIHELSELFQIKQSDCIFQSSPYTFDPFFVELLLSLSNSSSLMIVSNSIKLNPTLLAEILFDSDNNHIDDDTSWCCDSENRFFFIDVKPTKRRGISVLQMTPSIYTRWSNQSVKEFILSPNTSLKVLILGGERFPVKILRLKHCDNKTRIFNIYGITEVSCWAFISEIDSHLNEISIGKPLKGITYKISEEGVLFIGSKTRICLVDNETSHQIGQTVYRDTGDIFKITKAGLCYMGRSNNVIKKYGIKVDLNKIRKEFTNSNGLNCCCVYDELNSKLALFYVPCNKTTPKRMYDCVTLEDFLKRGYYNFFDKITDIEKPDYLVEISEMPVNCHGKCDRQKLLEYVRDIQLKNKSQNKIDMRESFLRIWCETLNLRENDLVSRSFTDLGGSSVLALQLVTKLQDGGWNVAQDFLGEVLGGGDFETCWKCLSRDLEFSEIPRKRMRKDSSESEIIMSIRWKFDLGKCVDATPTFVACQRSGKVIVGSHSSRLSCVDSDSGAEIWTIQLGDRIESGFTVTRDGLRGYVGCYDGFVSCVSILEGQLLWKYRTGDMVKSTPCLSSDEDVLFVGSYDKHLHCLSSQDGQLISKIKLSEGGIYSSGVSFGDLKTFHVGTLDGTCLALHQDTKDIVWKVKLKSPIFASSCLIPQRKHVIFAEVIGVVHSFDALTGVQMWNYRAGGNIYSSPVLEATEIIFGCHDGHVYSLQDGEAAMMKWKRQLDSSVFARPCVFALESGGVDRWTICAATTKGFVYLCDSTSGSILARTQLPGEVFSSPVCRSNRVFIGCRDNYLYCLDIFGTENT